MATTVASNVAPKSPRNRRQRVKSVMSIEPTNLDDSVSNLNGSDGNLSASGSASRIIMSPNAYPTGSRVGTIALQIERRDPSKSPRPNRQTLGIQIPRTHALPKDSLLEEENSPSKLSSPRSPHSIRTPAEYKSVLGDEQRRRKVTESPRTPRKTTVVSRQDIRQYLKARNLRHTSPPDEPGELTMVWMDSPTSPVEEREESIREPRQRKDGKLTKLKNATEQQSVQATPEGHVDKQTTSIEHPFQTVRKTARSPVKPSQSLASKSSTESQSKSKRSTHNESLSKKHRDPPHSASPRRRHSLVHIDVIAKSPRKLETKSSNDSHDSSRSMTNSHGSDEERSPSSRKHRDHHYHHSSSPRKLHANQKSPKQNIDLNESHDTYLYLEAEDTDKYLSTLMKELHQHTEQHREPLSDQAMIQLHLSRTQQSEGPGQGSKEEAEDSGRIMTLWEMKEMFRRDFPDAPTPSDTALKQRYKNQGLLRTAAERKSSFTSQNDSFSNVVQGSNSKSMDLSALNPSTSYSDRVTSTHRVTTIKHFGGDNSAATRIPVAIPWLDRQDNNDNDGSLENAGESEDASLQTHRKSGVTSFKNLASKVASAAKMVKSSNKTLEMSEGHNNIENQEQHEEVAKNKSRKERKDKVEEKLKKKEEKQLKNIEKAKQKLARAQRKLEKEKVPSKTDEDDVKTIHEEHESKLDSECTMGLSSESVKVDLEQSGGLEQSEVASQSTKKSGKSPPSKLRKSTLGKAMGRMSKILHPSHAKDKKWDELAMSEHSAFDLSVSRLQDADETTGERVSASIAEQRSLQEQEHTGEKEADINTSISHPRDAYCDLKSSVQQALQFQPGLKTQVEDYEYGEEALKSEPEPSRPGRKSRSSRTRSEDRRSSRSEGPRSRTSRSPSGVCSPPTKSSTSTCSTSSRGSRRSKSPSALSGDAARSPSRSSPRSKSPSTISSDDARYPPRSNSRSSKSPSTVPGDAARSPSRSSSSRRKSRPTVSDDAARSPSRSSSRKSKSPSTVSGDAARSPSRYSRRGKLPFTMTSEAEKSSSRSSRRSKSPSTLSCDAAKNRSDEDDGSIRKHSSEDSSKLMRNSRSVSPSGLKEDVSRRRRETRSASPSALRGDTAKLRDANGDRRNSRRASRRASTARSGPLDDETLEASKAPDCEIRIRRGSCRASNFKAWAPGKEAHEGSLTTETMSPDDEESTFVTASTASRVRFADQHLEDVKDCEESEGSLFAFSESNLGKFEDETEHTLSDTEFESISSMPPPPKSPDRLVQYVKNAGLVAGTEYAAARCISDNKTFAERLATMSTLRRRSDESEVKQVANAASSSELKWLKPPSCSSSELEDMLKMVGKNGSSKKYQTPKSGDNASRISRSSKASRASTKASRSSRRSEQRERMSRGSTREEGSKVSSNDSDLAGKPALTTGFQGVSHGSIGVMATHGGGGVL